MFTHSQAFHELKDKLKSLYDEREAAAIAHELLQHITGLNKTQRLIQKETLFTELQQQQFEQSLVALSAGMPLQYVTGVAWFMGKEYNVNRHVLIPRPETEELVQWVITDWKSNRGKINILDIGTGSGCISIALKLALPGTEITSVDISNDALAVAIGNAEKWNIAIQFVQLDFLDVSQNTTLDHYDIIISNPPYIPLSERDKMHTNVKDHEPAEALFVPDNDALIFYKAIAEFGKNHLKQNGYIYCELDPAHALECKELFEQAGYKNVEIRADMHGNIRIVRAGNYNEAAGYTNEFNAELDRRHESYKNGSSIPVTADESKERIQKLLKSGSKKENEFY